jgi:hypothetical protein
MWILSSASWLDMSAYGDKYYYDEKWFSLLPKNYDSTTGKANIINGKGKWDRGFSGLGS